MTVCDEPIITGGDTRCIVEGAHTDHFDGQTYWAVDQAIPEPPQETPPESVQISDLRKQIALLAQMVDQLAAQQP